MSDKPALTLISLGWGVQSFALAAMSAKKILPPVHAAIHSDTTHERAPTYEFAKRWTPWLEDHGVRVITISGGRPPIGTEKDGKGYATMPVFTRWSADVWWEPTHRCAMCLTLSDNPEVACPNCESPEPAFNELPADRKPVLLHRQGDKSGMLRRQCTGDWKIKPMNRWITAWLKSQGIKRTKGIAEQWIGITYDEAHRMRSSRAQYVKLAYPFIDYLGKPWTRTKVQSWLVSNGLEVPVKSSCYFCPYHSMAIWQDIRFDGSQDWKRAVEFDETIRNVRPGFWSYLHQKRVALTDVDMSTPEEQGQMLLWDAEECNAVCFL